MYRTMDCFVLPTRGEGWGRPIVEAMAMALPVIGTTCMLRVTRLLLLVTCTGLVLRWSALTFV